MDKPSKLVVELSTQKRITSIESIRSVRDNSVAIDMTLKDPEMCENLLMQFHSIIRANDYVLVSQGPDMLQFLVKTEHIICAFYPKGELL